MSSIENPLVVSQELAENYAGFWRRSAAALIDASTMFIPFCFLAVMAVVTTKLLGAAIGYDPAIAFLIVIPAVAVVSTCLYFAIMESTAWQGTSGKKILGLYVTDLHGNRLSGGRALGRTLAKYLSSTTVGVGFLMCGFTVKKQGLHDIAARCLVLRRTP